MNERKKLALAALLTLPVATNAVVHRSHSLQTQTPHAIHAKAGSSSSQYVWAFGISGGWAFAATVSAAIVCAPIGGVGAVGCAAAMAA
jgi:hypothetical protein